MDEQYIADNCFYYKTRVASRALGKVFDAVYRPLGLKGTQVMVLAGISLAKGTATIGKLASELGMDRTTLTRNLRPLERQGLVALGEEGWRRSRIATLTDAGREMLKATAPLWAEADEAVRRQIGPDHLATIKASLDALAEVR